MGRATATALILLAAASVAVFPAPAKARKALPLGELPRADEYLAPGISDRSPALPPFAPASATTTVLYYETFDDDGLCTAAGWTSVDLTAQIGMFFHVEDYAGLPFGPIQGTKSLWCGARASSDPALCRYATLPGYGNSWDQLWVSKACLSVNGDLDASFLMRLDTEASYDAVTLEYTTDCSGLTGWTILDGSINVWDGAQSLSINQSYSVGGATTVRVGIRFTSDGAWSDEDGLQDTDGAVHIDNLSVEGAPVEDFEDEASGATSSNLWIAASPPGYGTAAGLVLGASMLQDKDNCTRNIGCMWAFIEGSTATYGCGSQPQQTAVPFGNDRGQYLLNNILSPYIPISGTGNGWNLQFSLYSDLPLDNLVFWVWHVRSIDASGCPSGWADREFIGGYGVHGWREMVLPFGDLLNFTTATHVQVALGTWDLCGLWCGTVGSGACHTHSPMFDNVRVYRVDLQGPQWSIRSMDQFQDSFPSDGTLTGAVRADMANDVTPAANLNSNIPGDSAVVRVLDPSDDLGIDPVAGGAAVYGYVSVWPQDQTNKSGDHLTQNPARWPVVGSWVDADGVSWTCLRLDSSIVNGTPQPDIYCLDLNDNLFEPGDTVCFFYAAKNANGVETVAFGSNLALRSDDRIEAAADPGEFTCLPAGGYNRGGDVLYVDGADGFGAQAYWDLAFRSQGILDKVDRYDVRQPSGVSVSNRPEGRVANVTQLLIPYRKILWDCADLSKTLGDGIANFEKTDDWGLLNAFLAGLTDAGGVYLCGDDLPHSLTTAAGASAVSFRTTYLTFNLTTPDHRTAHPIAPSGESVLPGCFVSDASFIVQGGCPLLNDFDVMTPVGTARNEVTYGSGTTMSTNGAVLSQTTSNGTVDVGVLLGGFSFIYIGDDDLDGLSDRAVFLHDTLLWLGNTPASPSATGPARATRLGQNYPNPFNPQTTIAFSLARRGAVTLAVYDVAGRLVRRLVDGTADAGAHSATWDGRTDAGTSVASGVYFYKLVAGDFVQTRKMVLLK